ncbi:MAG: hypothetical protein OXF02_07720 [Simkaniaceae bacterium]|nr:hypothetical protein [Simkaniaceae bacterium]
MTKSEPFEEHVAEELPSSPFSFYEIVSPYPREGEFLLSLLLEKLEGDLVRIDPDRCFAETFAKEFDSPSMLSARKVLLCRHVGAQEAKGVFAHKIKAIPGDLSIIRTGRTLLFPHKKIERSMIVDLSSEQWKHRDARLRRWLRLVARKEGTTLSSDALRDLEPICREHFGMACKEVEKLALFAGNNGEINGRMIRALTSVSPSANPWKVAEKIVWEGKWPRLYGWKERALQDLVTFLRFHMQLGLVLSSALKKGEGEEITRDYPKLSAKAMAYYTARASRIPVDRWLSSLRRLYLLELRLRTQSTLKIFLLLDMFRMEQ